MRQRAAAAALALVCLLTPVAGASGPRFVTGPPFFTGQAGVPVGWKQTTLLYSTDPGNLSANVNHATADALVAAAAAVWNVPVANITLQQGGQLAEHVSGANVYLDPAGLHLPADAMSTNAAAVPIAVIYDTDGSVTDTLLGAGASDPSGCRQNAVTESVDAFDPAGYILHALIIVNGRCTGTANEAQLQLKYQLERVFGRVLGLGWSQTNDNVFTGSPRPTPVQAQNWPIMHPVDIVCGLYTYQCLPSPFALRIDDIAGLVSVYPIPVGSAAPAGKQVSLTGAQGVAGFITFPTGQGMAGVNVVVRREAGTTALPDAFYVGSAVTGAYFRHGGVSPFVTAPATASASIGSDYSGLLGEYSVSYFPLIGTAGFENVLTSTESVNPLYVGAYSLGPYAAGNVAPAGSPVAQTTFVSTALGVSSVNLTVADAPAVCGAGGDGVRTGPMQAAAAGWWNGLLCGYGHASYVQANVKPGHSFTLEVTALDEQGLATTSKAMPVMGLYSATDAVGAVPSLGLTPSAFNGRTVGTTSLSASTGTATTIEFGIADQRGDGRPDYPYQARLFYADDVTPARIAATGGTLTITGMGFRNGNAVTINGVSVTPTSWSTNTIVVAAPAMATVGATGGLAVDLVISDRTTGAVSTLTAAITYDPAASLPNAMRVVSAPAGTVLVGDVAATPFTVQVVAANGVTPIAGAPVVFSATAGSVLFGACNGSTCLVNTDSTGKASTTVTASAAGSITLQAMDGTLRETSALNAESQPTAMELLSVPENSVKVGTGSNSWFQVRLVGADGHTGLAGKPIVFSTDSGSVTYPACSTSPCTVLSDQFGLAGMSVYPNAIGPIVATASYGDFKRTASLTGVSNTDVLRIVALPLDTNLGGTSFFTVQLLQSDGYSADANRRIVFSAPAGLTLGQCGASTCELPTDYYGRSTVVLNPSQAGTFTVQATYGSLVQSATFQVTVPSRQLKLLSVPANNSATGVPAAAPFSVQLLQADGVTPMTGVMVSLAGPPGAVILPMCLSPACEVPVDSQGIASVAVTPLLPGNITMSATYAPLVTTATFKAVGTGETIKFLAQPGSGGAPYGVPQTFTVQVLQADGVTPYSWDQVRIAVLSGPFVLLNSSTAAALANTDQYGLASCQGIAVGNGMVVVQASDGVVTQTVTFMAGTSPDVMRVVATPPATVTLGSGIAGAFSVQLSSSDGVTPIAARNVTFSVTNGSAVLGPCSAAVCAVATDANGIATVNVTALAAGSVALLAAEANVSQAAAFIAVRPPDVLSILSVPASGGYVGSVGTPIFAVQAMLAGGSSPAAGRTITIAVTGGAAVLNACGSTTCSLLTDAQGAASTSVTPLGAGTIVLTATDTEVSATASFSAAPRPDTMRIVSAPAGNVGVGYAASTPFSVQVMTGDGMTPRAGKTVVFSAVGPGVNFGACGMASCPVVTGADGVASSTVTPLASGGVTLTATEEQLSQSASFTAVMVPDVLTVVSAPPSGGYVGDAAAIPFAVHVDLGDGVTAAVGHHVTISVTNGKATLTACGGSICTMQADALGMASTGVTPLAAGPITLTATDGLAAASVSFSAIAKPDVMLLMSAPTGSLPTGVIAGTAFAVKLVQGDGVSADVGKSVIFSGSGVSLGACGGASCTVMTGPDGVASTSVTPLAAGVGSMVATFGTLVQTATLTGYVRPDVLRMLSVPADGSFTGVPANAPLTVLVLQGDGVTPAANRSVIVSVTNGMATLSACGGGSSCPLVTDAHGVLSTGVVPGSQGTIVLQAKDNEVVVTASFAAVARPDVMTVVSGPADSLVGVQSTIPFAVSVLQGDGLTPEAGRAVVFSVTSGSATFAACPGAATCMGTTDARGLASMAVTATTAGTITLQAADGVVMQSVSFGALQRPDGMQVLSSPASGSYVGLLAAAPFRVLVTQGDGVTPAAGRKVTVTVTNGSAALDACAGPGSCVMTTDQSGQVSTGVTPLAAGPTTLQAADGDVVHAATFLAVLRPNVISVLSAPGSGSDVGVGAGVPFRVAVMQGDGVTPAAAESVTVAVTSGSAGFAACGGAAVCTLLTDASGTAATAVIPLSAGSITLQASDGPAQQSASFTAVLRPNVMKVISVPASGAYVGAVAGTTFRVAVMQGDGVTPATGENVTVTVTNGSASLAACGGLTGCVLVTDGSGVISTAVTPLAAGTVAIQAADGAVTQTVSFVAVDRPDVLRLVSAPSGAVYVGAAAQALVVQLVLGDGVTPHAGAGVFFSTAGAAAQLSGCAATCEVVTDANGTASVVATPLASGTITLTAAVGGLSQTASFQGVTNTYSVSGNPSATYVAEGATVTLALSMVAAQNGVAAPGQSVRWAGAASFEPKQTASVTNVAGMSSIEAALGPLAGGSTATLTACAWTDQCATFTGVGVSPSQLAVTIVSGAGQSAGGGAVFAPVVALLTDGAAHPVAGAAVTIYQTVTAADVACPDRGRCPAAPVLASLVTATTADNQGRVSVAPLMVIGRATQTEMSLSAGTSGFISSILTSAP